MTTKIQLAQSDYNKTDYVKLNVQDSKRIVFSEAVTQENDDKVVVYAYVTEIDDKIEVFGQKDYTFTPQICYFELLKKEREYNGKKTTPTPGMTIAIHAISQLDAVNPFMGYFDLSKNQWDCDVIVKGSVDGQAVPKEMQEFASKSAYSLSIVPADVLKDFKMPELKGGKSGGYKAQSEAERITQRLSSCLAQLEKGSLLHQICEKLQTEGVTALPEIVVSQWLDKVIN